MFSKIRTYLRPVDFQNYFSKKNKRLFQQHFKSDVGSSDVDYGELIYTHASPFLWPIPRGLNVQTIENNMFIAPIYRQQTSSNDFLVIVHRRNEFFIRNLSSMYLIGQQCPLIEVPIPQSKRVNLFQRDLLQIYIYRLFLQSNENPRRIRIDDIKRVFPRLAESSIRKRLKTSADFRRTGIFSSSFSAKKHNRTVCFFFSFSMIAILGYWEVIFVCQLKMNYATWSNRNSVVPMQQWLQLNNVWKVDYRFQTFSWVCLFDKIEMLVSVISIIRDWMTMNKSIHQLNWMKKSYKRLGIQHERI